MTNYIIEFKNGAKLRVMDDDIMCAKFTACEMLGLDYSEIKSCKEVA